MVLTREFTIADDDLADYILTELRNFGDLGTGAPQNAIDWGDLTNEEKEVVLAGIFKIAKEKIENGWF